MWRAANGINPKPRDQQREAKLETVPALWKQRLDRDIASVTYPGLTCGLIRVVKGVRSGLPSLGSGALRPNRTGPNH